MSAKRFIMQLRFLKRVAIGFAVAATIQMGVDMTSNGQSLKIETAKPILPLLSMNLKISPGAREHYFSLLKEFAREHRLQAEIAVADQARQWYTTKMIGEHILITGNNISDINVFLLKVLPKPGKTALQTVSLVTSMLSDLEGRITSAPEIEVVSKSGIDR